MKNVTFQFHAALSSLEQNKMTYIFEQSPSGLGFSARMREAGRTHEGLACVAHPAFCCTLGEEESTGGELPVMLQYRRAKSTNGGRYKYIDIHA
jgi:hypothetical protein